MSKIDEIMDKFPQWSTEEEMNAYVARFMEAFKRDEDLLKFIDEEREKWVNKIKLN